MKQKLYCLFVLVFMSMLYSCQKEALLEQPEKLKKAASITDDPIVEYPIGYDIESVN